MSISTEQAYKNVLAAACITEAALMRKEGDGFTTNLLPDNSVGIEFHYPMAQSRVKHFLIMLKKLTGHEVLPISGTVFAIPDANATDLMDITGKVSKAWKLTQERIPILGGDM